MYELGILIVLATSIWVAFDAPTHGLSRTWGLGCAALWIVAFPWYLLERSRARRPTPAATAPRPATTGRWEPDPRNPEKMERWREGTRWTRAIRKRGDV